MGEEKSNEHITSEVPSRITGPSECSEVVFSLVALSHSDKLQQGSSPQADKLSRNDMQSLDVITQASAEGHFLALKRLGALGSKSTLSAPGSPCGT